MYSFALDGWEAPPTGTWMSQEVKKWLVSGL